MKKINNLYKKIFVFSALFLTACETTQSSRIFDNSINKSAVELRSVQQRAFDTKDQNKTLRTIIATLQDLSFVIDKADMELGSVSATKLDSSNQGFGNSGYVLKMTVSSRPAGNRTIIRANAQFNATPVVEPKPYQDFFMSLEKAMFLTAHQVE
jgi:hypothetical protein